MLYFLQAFWNWKLLELKYSYLFLQYWISKFDAIAQKEILLDIELNFESFDLGLQWFFNKEEKYGFDHLLQATILVYSICKKFWKWIGQTDNPVRLMVMELAKIEFFFIKTFQRSR